jgi:hypothetical protein
LTDIESVCKPTTDSAHACVSLAGAASVHVSRAGRTDWLTKSRRTIMKKYSLLKRATAAALLSATIVTPAVVGLTAGTANARPRDMQCLAYAKAMDQSTQLAHIAYEQGDKKMGNYYGDVADRAYANLVRNKCLS